MRAIWLKSSPRRLIRSGRVRPSTRLTLSPSQLLTSPPRSMVMKKIRLAASWASGLGTTVLRRCWPSPGLTSFRACTASFRAGHSRLPRRVSGRIVWVMSPAWWGGVGCDATSSVTVVPTGMGARVFNTRVPAPVAIIGWPAKVAPVTTP